MHFYWVKVYMFTIVNVLHPGYFMCINDIGDGMLYIIHLKLMSTEYFDTVCVWINLKRKCDFSWKVFEKYSYGNVQKLSVCVVHYFGS